MNTSSWWYAPEPVRALNRCAQELARLHPRPAMDEALAQLARIDEARNDGFITEDELEALVASPAGRTALAINGLLALRDLRPPASVAELERDGRAVASEIDAGRLRAHLRVCADPDGREGKGGEASEQEVQNRRAYMRVATGGEEYDPWQAYSAGAD